MHCYWPPNTVSNAWRRKAIATSAAPKESWPVHPVTEGMLSNLGSCSYFSYFVNILMDFEFLICKVNISITVYLFVIF